jgi:hypothetical protein
LRAGDRKAGVLVNTSRKAMGELVVDATSAEVRDLVVEEKEKKKYVR